MESDNSVSGPSSGSSTPTPNMEENKHLLLETEITQENFQMIKRIVGRVQREAKCGSKITTYKIDYLSLISRIYLPDIEKNILQMSSYAIIPLLPTLDPMLAASLDNLMNVYFDTRIAYLKELEDLPKCNDKLAEYETELRWVELMEKRLKIAEEKFKVQEYEKPIKTKCILERYAIWKQKLDEQDKCIQAQSWM